MLETGRVTEGLHVREIDDDEGRRLARIIPRGSGSVVTWRRVQMVLLSAQGMDVPAIAKVAFTSEDRVRDVIRNFNADGFAALYPRRRMRATYPRTEGVRSLLAACELLRLRGAERGAALCRWLTTVSRMCPVAASAITSSGSGP